MKSNFLPLKKVSIDLFNVIHSAEHLFSNSQYDYIPTALRIFTEGIMQEILGIDPSDNTDLSTMIRQFDHQYYPSNAMSTSAAHNLRIEGNKSSHFKPHVLEEGDLNKLFKQAFRLQDFYLKEFKKLKVTTGKFDKSNFPLAIGGGVLDRELQHLQQKLPNNSTLLADSIEEIKQQNITLEKKIAFYKQELEQTTSASKNSSMAKHNLEIEINLLRNKLLEEKKSTSSSNVAGKQQAFENEGLKLKIEQLSQKITVISQQQQRYLLESDIYTEKVNKIEIEKEKQIPKRADLIEKANIEIEFNSNSSTSNSVLELDEKQEELINISTGLHFLAAPPGSGKTMILTKRLERALATYHNDADIICLTFTTRAAKEMCDRAERHLVSSSTEKRTPFIGNFHNFCLTLHRENKNISIKDRFATILDDDFRKDFFQKSLLKIEKENEVEELIESPYSKLVEELYGENQNNLASIKSRKLDHYLFLSPKLYPYLSLLHLLQQNESLDPLIIKFVQNQVKEHLHQAIIALHSYLFSSDIHIDYMYMASLLWKLLLEFKECKAQANAIDYDDILCSGLICLIGESNPKKFIQIDEAQDLNPIQWLIIDQLKSENTNIFAVGDSDQSIYSFLGANAQSIEHETHHFTKHSLINNYRSNPEIVKLLNSYRKFCWDTPNIISKNDKTSINSTMLFQFNSVHEELSNTAVAIKSILKDPKRDIGILLPTNKRVDALCSVLDFEKLSYFRVSSSDLMQRPIIQDWFSLLKMHKGTANRIDWYKIVYRLAQTDSSKEVIKRSSAIDFVNRLYMENISISDIAEIKSNNPYQHRLKTLIEAWEDKGVVIFDTETTGLDFDESKIVQLAAIKVQKGKITAIFDKYIQVDLKDTKVSKDFEASSEIHKITREQINNGDEERDVYSTFFDFVGGKPLIAHNMNFDNTMLRMGVMRLGDVDLENRFCEATQSSQFDTLLLARSLLPNEESYKLVDLLKSHNLEGVNSHNALDDVKATASLVELLIQKIKDRVQSVDEIIDEYPLISNQVQKKITQVNHFLRGFYASGEKIKLSSMLEEWGEYVYQQDWYDSSSKDIVLKEMKNKLCSWLESEGYQDHIQDLLNDMNPQYQKLATLKESDLIQKNKDKVIVSTIHRAKGLEFHTVIVPEVTSGQYPGWRPKETPKYELEQHKAEQKRLLYVALSRPKNKLIVSYHLTNANGYKTNVSDYLKGSISAFSWKNF